MTLVYNPQSKISPHFTHREVQKSSTADRNDIDNTPSTSELMNANLVANKVIEPIRVHYGIPFSPQSWFRCEELEKRICWGSFVKWCLSKDDITPSDANWNQYFSRKSHPTGGCVDIEIPSVPNDDLFEWIRTDSGLVFDQLIREFPKDDDPESGWVHVSYSATNNRQSSFTIG